jgi:N-acetylneuraminic acid mutarotase
MGGIDNSLLSRNDLWQYDISSNAWTQKNNFPGPERYGAVSFVLNNFGYIVAGGNDNGYLDDLWEYDSQNNLWLQKTGLPAGSAQHENQRVEAYAFVVNNRAYVGGGSGFVFGANQTFNIAFYDLWEYEPIGDNWTQKSDVPDFIGRNMSVAVSINGKGYVGLGCDVDQTTNRKSFWEYDPSLDAWTAKSDFPTDFTADAGAVVYNSELYVVGGVNLNPVGLSNQVYKYDPVFDTWTQMPNFLGAAIAGEFAVTTSTSAFIGGGYNAGIIPRNDLYEISNSTAGIISPVNPENDHLFYPNPANDKIHIVSGRNISEIRVYNSLGENVLTAKDVSGELNVERIPPGSYVMKIIHRDTSFDITHFIKNN